MKKVNDLMIKRSEVLAQYDAIKADETKLDERKSLLDQVETIDAQIDELKRGEKLASKFAEERKVEVEQNDKPFAVQFRDWLTEAANGGSKRFELRADPILTSTTSAVINKTVANSMDILTSPGEAFLRQLGVQIFTGLNGNLVLPSLAEDTAEFVSEAGDASTSDMAPEALTLAGRRVSAFQGITRETLAQTNPAIFNGILQNLVNGIWKAVTYDVFDQVETDAATQKKTTGASITWQNVVDMEASIGGLNIGSGAYVTTPAGKAYLKNLNAGSAGIKFAWADDNTLNGYNAYGVPAANANRVYFGDFSKVAVGQFGEGITLIYDEVTKAKQGEIIVTAVAMFDSGVVNKRGLAILDASLY